MTTPIYEGQEPKYRVDRADGHAGPSVESSDENAGTSNPNTLVNEKEPSTQRYLKLDVLMDANDVDPHSPSQTREKARRLDDELAMLQAERLVTNTTEAPDRMDQSVSMKHTRSHRAEPIDEFDAATNPVHEQTSIYKPPVNPTNKVARFAKKVHESSFLIRYLTYIIPVVLIILIPLLVGALAFPDAHVGGVQLMWFCVWLEIVWLTLWAARIVAKFIPVPVNIVASIFTNNAKKWRDLAEQLELPAALFFWLLAIEISFIPTMTNHHIRGGSGIKHWEEIMHKVVISFLVGMTLNFIEKLIIQLIAISFHLRTYADRIEINKFEIGSLTKLYAFSRETINMKDREFEVAPENAHSSGTRTPMQYADRAQKVARGALSKVGDIAGTVAGDFTGKKLNNSTHPYQVILALLSTTSGSQVLARRLYRTFVQEGSDTIFASDLKPAFENGEEAEAAFTMFDKDMNGDISMEELEAVCVEIGRERKSITASLKDLDSVVSKLDDVFMFIVVVITILVFLSLISASAAGVLTSAGSTLLALSWLFSATAQEFLQSIIFVFVKHPYDVGDRVGIYGNTGATLTGDDYYVKEIALLYTEFKKLQGHVVQAPNSYLNTLFILNQRRSGGLAEVIPIVIKFGTTLEQIDILRQQLLEFVCSEKREYQTQILTELRDVTENFSITLNVVFFYKSNWQNELLRLQRRNKFVCNLMVCLQELGIEGPRMNLLGYKKDLPYHMHNQGAPPQYTAGSDENPPPPSDPQQSSEARDGLGELGTASGSQLNSHPSILRNRSGTASSTRSNRNKHVDFSLGMQSMSASDDLLSDVHTGRERGQVGNVVRAANRDAAERREQESQEKVQERRQLSLERTRSRQPRGSLDSHQTGASQLGGAGRGDSMSSSVHRNRFLSKLGSRGNGASSTTRSPAVGTGEEDIEQGRYNAPYLRPEASHSTEHVSPSAVGRIGSRESREDDQYELTKYPRP